MRKIHMINELDSALNCHSRLSKNYFYAGLTTDELDKVYQLYQISLHTLIVSNVFAKLIRVTQSKQFEDFTKLN